MWDILSSQLRSGAGPVLAALVLLSVAGLAVTIVKARQFRAAGIGRSDRGSDGSPSLRQRVLAAASAGGNGGAEARERATALAEEEAIDELGRLARHLAFLDAVVQAAPMLGLLGTVFGMIEVFFTLSGSEGAIDPALLSGGIFAALLTTAAGLSVAIPFFFAAAYFEAALDAETRAIEALILRAVHGAPPRAGSLARGPQGAAREAMPGGMSDRPLARPG
ncbi:MotA/TolQ/ExbB proton channel family protein [Aurantimonas sp. 22II-16-19i]|uniref:MotA/TolQ/ExbB proton channel family protein n=1 Tax=Aurantimonas sp. 22II-16-19i TaxID=1317114 RepID=UPI0009F7F7EA|nr:MotA/TolQ/ExbB proton channel family protein [Aurantimonas sp. 22II-16-19i]ORE94946.1 MotA/TolQ/ExbB proton channel [Aurantimonas sp. 22II-16-19i]